MKEAKTDLMLIRGDYGQDHAYKLDISEYPDGAISVCLVAICGLQAFPDRSLTMNPHTRILKGHAYIDAVHFGIKIIDWLVDNKLGRATGKFGDLGDKYLYPEFIFDLDEIKKYKI